MIEPLVFVVPGTPQGKGRPRFSSKSNTTYTPPNSRAYEATVGRMALVGMRGREQFSGPLHMDMRAHFAIPASWSKDRKTAALLGLLKPTSKPDIDNLLKAVADGMNGIVYADDAAIVSFSCSKVYAAGDGFVAITVRPVSHRVPSTQLENAEHERAGHR